MPHNNFKNIRQAIVDKLNSNDVSTVQVAYKSDRSTFSGFPAVVVSPSSNEADYESTAVDKLTIVFQVRVYYLIADEEDQEPAELALEGAVDELLDVFGKRDALESSAFGDSVGWVKPVPSVWEYEVRGDAVYRVATLTLNCEKYVNN